MLEWFPTRRLIPVGGGEPTFFELLDFDSISFQQGDLSQSAGDVDDVGIDYASVGDLFPTRRLIPVGGGGKRPPRRAYRVLFPTRRLIPVGGGIHVERHAVPAVKLGFQQGDLSQSAGGGGVYDPNTGVLTCFQQGDLSQSAGGRIGSVSRRNIGFPTRRLIPVGGGLFIKLVYFYYRIISFQQGDLSQSAGAAAAAVSAPVIEVPFPTRRLIPVGGGYL